MTPVAAWSPVDYYRASRAARRASERSLAQLQLPVLDEDDKDAVLLVEHPELTDGVEPRCELGPHRPVSRSRPLVPPDVGGASAPLTATDPGRHTSRVHGGRGQQKGAF